MSTPALPPNSRAHMPAQLTTASQAMLPSSPAALPGDAGDPTPAAAAFHPDRRYLDAFDQGGARRPRAFGQGQGDVGGIALAVARQMDGAGDVADLEMGIHRLHLGRRRLVHLDAEGAGQRGGAIELFAPLAGQGPR